MKFARHRWQQILRHLLFIRHRHDYTLADHDESNMLQNSAAKELAQLEKNGGSK
jgi:hypothetical protein